MVLLWRAFIFNCGRETYIHIAEAKFKQRQKKKRIKASFLLSPQSGGCSIIFGHLTAFGNGLLGLPNSTIATSLQKASTQSPPADDGRRQRWLRSFAVVCFAHLSTVFSPSVSFVDTLLDLGSSFFPSLLFDC